MSDGMTKRERQKERRRERLAVEAAQQRVSRRRRLGVLAVVGVLMLGLLGTVVQRQFAERAARAERANAVMARLDELGCTEAQEMESLGAEHLQADGGSLAGFPPSEIYPDRPTTSGPHMPLTAATGVYEQPLDERLTTHNLEHGYMVVWHDEQADAEAVEDLRGWARQQIDGDFPKIIVAPYFEELPGEAEFVSAAWGVRQQCEQFNRDVAQVFLEEHHSSNGEAPESAVPATRGGEGVPAPDSDAPLLFPPLDAATEASSDDE